MEKSFINLFKGTLEIEDRELNLNDVFRDYPEWNSLMYLSVISMIDEEYDITIEGNDFRKLRTISDLVEEIKKRTT